MSAYKMCPRTTSLHLIAFSILWQMQYRDENSVFLHKYLDNNNPHHKEWLVLIPIAWVTRVRGKNFFFFFQISIVKYRAHPVDYRGPSYIASSKSLILIFSSVHMNRFSRNSSVFGHFSRSGGTWTNQRFILMNTPGINQALFENVK